ncbi:MAG: DUF4911 domain-containing protein [Desulfobacterales bacterium]|nr:DUF4911 domain-containing protein [Desulfobacterales bacterium]
MDPNRCREKLRTTQHLYRVDRRDISFLRFILEAYDGIAVVTTRDAVLGIVSVTVAPGCEALVAEVIASLAAEDEIYLEPLATGVAAGHGQEFQCTSFT